jgi:uncharacterized protein (TIGR03437 family)
MFTCRVSKAEEQNGAGFGAAIAPGSWATVYGTFTGVTQQTGAIPVGNTLGGVSITVAGLPAPVYFVSAGQINFIVPAAAPSGLQPFQVKTASATLDSTIRLIPAAPGIFTQDTATPPKGAVLNQNFSVNTASNPALRGEFIQIYGSGPGVFASPVTDGAPAPQFPDLNLTRSTPQAFVAGVPAEVQFSGLAPGFAALWQFNVKIPSQTFVTGRVPLIVYVDGVNSNEVSIFVQ